MDPVEVLVGAASVAVAVWAVIEHRSAKAAGRALAAAQLRLTELQGQLAARELAAARAQDPSLHPADLTAYAHHPTACIYLENRGPGDARNVVVTVLHPRKQPFVGTPPRVGFLPARTALPFPGEFTMGLYPIDVRLEWVDPDGRIQSRSLPLELRLA